MEPQQSCIFIESQRIINKYLSIYLFASDLLVSLISHSNQHQAADNNN